MEFVFKYRDFVSKYHQNRTKLLFQFFGGDGKADEEIIIEFTKGDLFNYQSRQHFDPHTHEWEGLWNSPINFHLLSSNHFKQYNRSELNTFLGTYLMNRPWVVEERINFQDQVNSLNNEMDKCTSGIFFITCLEWFDTDDDVLTNGSKCVYENYYYMLLSWIDKRNDMIILYELDAD